MITQVELFSEKFAGRAGEAVHPVTGAPLAINVVGETVIELLTCPLVPVAPAKLSVGGLAFIVRETELELDPPAVVTVTV